MENAMDDTDLSRLELKLNYLLTLAANAGDHASYLEAASKVVDLIPEILVGLRPQRGVTFQESNLRPKPGIEHSQLARNLASASSSGTAKPSMP